MLAGIDVSGDPQSGNNRFMGMVVGTEEGIEAVVGRLETRPIHMTKLRRDEQNAVIDSIAFDDATCMGFCIHTEKSLILSRLADRMRGKQGFLNRKKLSRTFNAVLWSMMHTRVEDFMYGHGFEIHRLCVQCDHDSKDFVKDRGWRIVGPGSAYELADALAWANRRGREPKGTVSLDLAGSIEVQMRKRFR